MDTSQPDSSVAEPAQRSWRRHSDEFKARVVAMARQGHGSVAAVALTNGLNANMLRRWVRESEIADAAPAVMGGPAACVPVTLADLGDRTLATPESLAATPPPERVTLEIRRGTTSSVPACRWMRLAQPGCARCWGDPCMIKVDAVWLRAGQRAAAIMSLLHSARINGHEPNVYLKDVLERLPTHPASRIDELLPHRSMPTAFE